MAEVSDLLQSYVECVRRLSGAGSATLFVPASASSRTVPILIQDGDFDPVPELADLAAAVSFSEAIDGDSRMPDEAVAVPSLRMSSVEGGCLVALPSVPTFPALEGAGSQAGAPSSPGPRRRHSDPEGKAPDASTAAWLGLRYEHNERRELESFRMRGLPFAVGEGNDTREWWSLLFGIGGALASHTSQISMILRDPVTGLRNRTGFLTQLGAELQQARLDSATLALLMVNPDHFAPINERFGREAGDEIVCEISRRLRVGLRASDSVSRYGGVIFVITLMDTSLKAAKALAQKLRRGLAEGAYLDGAVRLGFSIGIAVSETDGSDGLEPVDLIRRADQALNAAKRQGGNQVFDWEQRAGVEESGNFDRLSGIFTGNMSKDYRNMVLLSDAIEVIAANREFHALAAEMVEKLYVSYRPDRVALFSVGENGALAQIRGITRQLPHPGALQDRVETVELDGQELELVRLAVEEAEPRTSRRAKAEETEGAGAELLCYAIPLVASDDCVGCLYLDGSEDTLPLERSDLIFLRAFASQLAVALDRARLAELERNRRDLERQELKAELKELRHAVQQSRLVYRSSEMEEVIAMARRVALTDATVLIIGASGTGKELIARTVHELSERRQKPLVVVDCGSISSSLIESELFGYERGAFTGAQQRHSGRLAEAVDGTVLLDEIGELPLEVQSKLLRFVQEKQFTRVGGTRIENVDVRIIAATNRDLAAEVASGRFREDLYYRLNVVRLDVPPLSARPDDILHLAHHFLETYVVQYQKNLRLTPEADDALLHHSWPGNVRELQNRMMQAVILCEGELIGPADLKLPLPESPSAVPPPEIGRELLARQERPPPFERASVGDVISSGASVPRVSDSSVGELWPDLQRALSRQVEAVFGAGSRSAVPLGRWLSEDIVLQAAAAADSNTRRAAARVGIPGTTFRRRLQKANEQSWAGLATRSRAWEEVRRVLQMIIERPAIEGEELLSRAEQVLLAEILRHYPSDGRTGAVLLGVSRPTFRRRMAAFREAAERQEDAVFASA